MEGQPHRQVPRSGRTEFATEGPGEHVFGVLPRDGESPRRVNGARLEPPITQATAHGNNVVGVYADRVELRSGFQGQHVETLAMREVTSVNIQGWVNCTLTIESNTGRLYKLDRMALPDARSVKSAIERQKEKASIYE